MGATAPRAPSRQSSTELAERVFGPQVLLVSGKGGVGKTTISAALAAVAAEAGRRTLLVDIEGTGALASVCPPVEGASGAARGSGSWGYEPARLAENLYGLAVDPAKAVFEYLRMYYGIRGVERLMRRSQGLDLVTTIAPGLRDLLLIGKIYELHRRQTDGRAQFDSIIVDAPPAGQVGPLLRTADSVQEIVRAGPIREQAGSIKRMLVDSAAAGGIVVSTPDDMPATEALAVQTAMVSLGMSVPVIVLNQSTALRGPRSRESLQAVERVAAASEDQIGQIIAGLNDAHLYEVETGLRRAVSDHANRLVIQITRQRGVAQEIRQWATGVVLSAPRFDDAHSGAEVVAMVRQVLGHQLGYGSAPAGFEAFSRAARRASEPAA